MRTAFCTCGARSRPWPAARWTRWRARALKSDLASLYRFKGTVSNYASLPTTGNTVGDVWNVSATGMNYAWTGGDWDALGQEFQIESITNAEIDAITSEG